MTIATQLKVHFLSLGALSIIAILLFTVSRNTSERTNIEVGGVIEGDTVWSNESEPYVVTEQVYIPSGTSLTIEAGVIVRFEPGTKILVQANGRLNVLGEDGNKVLLTANSSNPQAGDWRGIEISAGAITQFDHAEIAYSQFGISTNANSTSIANTAIHEITNNAIYSGVDLSLSNINVNGSTFAATIYAAKSLTLTESTVTGGAQGIYVHEDIYLANSVIESAEHEGVFANQRVQLINNTIKNNNNAAVMLWDATHLKDSIFQRNTYVGNESNYVVVYDSTITGDEHWDNSLIGEDIAFRNLTLSESGSLTLDAGTVMRFEPEGKFTVNGTINLKGTVDHPILFTSSASIPSIDDWDGVSITTSDIPLVLNNFVIEYAGHTSSALTIDGESPSYIYGAVIRNNDRYGVISGVPLTVEDSYIYNNDSAISANGTPSATGGYTLVLRNSIVKQNRVGVFAIKALIDNSNILDNEVAGLEIWGGTVTDSTIANNISTGIVIRAQSQTVIRDAVIYGNEVGVDIDPQSQRVTLSNSQIYENVVGLHSNSYEPIDARMNWWGSVSGPWHEIDNPNGEGNSITRAQANVQFHPFRTEPSYASIIQSKLITIGTPIDITLSRGEYHYFRVAGDVVENMVSRLKVTSEPSTLVSDFEIRLLSGAGYVPIGIAYDEVVTVEKSKLEAELPVSHQNNDEHFFTLFAPITDDNIQVSLLVTSTTLYVSDVAPKVVGNADEVTFRIRGTGLLTNTIMRVRTSNSSLLSPSYILSHDDTHLVASFDLNGASIGDADLIIERVSDNYRFERDKAFRIVEGGHGKLRFSLDGPSTVRRGRQNQFVLEYTNDGVVDLRAPFLSLEIENGSLTMGNQATSRLVLLLGGDDGRGDAISPGETGFFTFDISAVNTGRLIVKEFLPTNDFYDWSAIASAITAYEFGHPVEEWESNFVEKMTFLGNTESSIFSTLRQMNSRYGRGIELSELFFASLIALDESGLTYEENVAAIIERSRQESGSISNKYHAASDIKVHVVGNGGEIDSNKPARIFIHGFRGGRPGDAGTLAYEEIARHEFSKNSDYNIVIVNWPQGAANPNGSLGALGDVRNASIHAAEVGKVLVPILSARGLTDWGETELIGESLGNVVAAYACRELRSRGSSINVPKAYFGNPANPNGIDGSLYVPYNECREDSESLETPSIFDANTNGLCVIQANNSLILRRGRCNLKLR